MNYLKILVIKLTIINIYTLFVFLLIKISLNTFYILFYYNK
jgi:hypothetical protein